MKPLQQPKGNKGFTLIELMISVCIMAVAFAGLATMQIACINGNSIANNLTTGVTLAQDMMEELNGLDYSDPLLADNNAANNAGLAAAYCDFTGSTTYPPGHYCLSAGVALQDDGHRETNIDEDGNAGGVYTRTWNIAADTPVTDRKTVVVIVIWGTHRISVSSIIGVTYT